MVKSMARNHFRIHSQIYDSVYNYFPAFDELFDEESFYLFAIGVTLTTIVVCYLLSRRIKLVEVEY